MITERFADRSNTDHKTFGVESLQEILLRIQQAWQDYETLSSEHDLIWVSHGDTLRVLLCFFQNLSLQFCHDLPYLNNAEFREIHPREKVKIAAHRGNSIQFTENTMPAFRSGIELKSDFLELDFHYTKDKVPIVIHDPDMNRVFGHDYKISELYYSQVAELTKREHTPPRLETVLDLSKQNNTSILCEMKAGWLNENDLPALIDDYKENLELMDFNYQNLISAQKTIDDLKCIWLIDHTDDWNKVIDMCKEHNFFCINPNKDLLLNNPHWIQDAKQEGLQVYTWTVDKLEEGIELILAGIDVITTNNPGLFLDLNSVP